MSTKTFSPAIQARMELASILYDLFVSEGNQCTDTFISGLKWHLICYGVRLNDYMKSLALSEYHMDYSKETMPFECVMAATETKGAMLDYISSIKSEHHMNMALLIFTDVATSLKY